MLLILEAHWHCATVTTDADVLWTVAETDGCVCGKVIDDRLARSAYVLRSFIYVPNLHHFKPYVANSKVNFLSKRTSKPVNKKQYIRHNWSLFTFDVLISIRDIYQKKFIHSSSGSCYGRVVTWKEISHTECVAALVTIHRLLTLFPNIYCLFDQKSGILYMRDQFLAKSKLYCGKNWKNVWVCTQVWRKHERR